MPRVDGNTEEEGISPLDTCCSFCLLLHGFFIFGIQIWAAAFLLESGLVRNNLAAGMGMAFFFLLIGYCMPIFGLSLEFGIRIVTFPHIMGYVDLAIASVSVVFLA